MKAQNKKTTGEKLFFGILFTLVASYILWTVSTMFISYDEYENLLKSILN
jgi:hypothetical protein